MIDAPAHHKSRFVARCSACTSNVLKGHDKTLQCGHVGCHDCYYFKEVIWCNECVSFYENDNYDANRWHEYLLNTYNP